jgi:hypothetical protein
MAKRGRPTNESKGLQKKPNGQSARESYERKKQRKFWKTKRLEAEVLLPEEPGRSRILAIIDQASESVERAKGNRKR